MTGQGAALGTDAAQALARSGRVRTDPGLTPRELAAVERRFGIALADDHAAFLAAALPLGAHWPDWRSGDPADLVERLAAPVGGVLFDVEHNDWWYPHWPPRPDGAGAALALAARLLATVPRLVPVYGHRYLPAGRGPGGHAVLSVHQTDLIVYGDDLADYVHREFGPAPGSGAPGSGTPEPSPRPRTRPEVTVAFWRDLVG